MKARLCLVAFVVLSLGVVVAGCGGSSGVAPDDTPTDLEQKFRIDFESNTVTVIEEALDGAAMVDSRPGSSSALFKLKLAVLASDAGNPGHRYVKATVRNNSPVRIGANIEGVASGVDLVFTSLRFEDGGGGRIDGGGALGYSDVNAGTGMPVYSIPGAVSRDKTSSAITITFVLPKNATTAIAGIVVRTNTEAPGLPTPSQGYLTTVAGLSGHSRHVNGPYEVARFYDVRDVIVREALNDVLVADQDRVRRVADGAVTMYVPGFPAPVWALAEDPDGNIIAASPFSDTIYITPAAGGAPYVMAGTGLAGNSNGSGTVASFRDPSGLAALGNETYVADPGNNRVRRVHYVAHGSSRLAASSYSVSTKATLSWAPIAVAVDHAGNVFVGTERHIHIAPVDTFTLSFIIAGGDGPGSRDGRGDVATVDHPTGMTVDGTGTVYIGQENGSVRRVRHIGGDKTLPTSWRVETLVPWTDVPPGADGSPGSVVNPLGLDIASDGTLWIADETAIRRLDREIH